MNNQNTFDKKFLKKELLKRDIDIRKMFLKRFEIEIDSFLCYCSEASSLFIDTDQKHRFNKRQAIVFSYLLTAMNDLFISLKLYISGYIIPSGNLIRHFIESISLALICHSCDNATLSKIDNGKYMANNAPSDVVKYLPALNLDKDFHNQLVNIRNWYHNYSHSTKLCTATYFSISEKDTIYFWGSEYDPEKEESYKKEIRMRSYLSGLLYHLLLIISDLYQKNNSDTD